MEWKNLMKLLKPPDAAGGGRALVACLGNPGREYKGTRHNAGFEVADRLEKAHGIEIRKAKRKSVVGEGSIAGKKVIFAKPQTYMNLSGEALVELMGFYKIALSDLLVVCDDASIPPGEIRIRKKGSAGGHNGLKNIIAHLGTDEFCRLRVGIGEKPPGWDMADYVLGSFKKDELPDAEEGFDKAAKAVEAFLASGADAAMNQYNRRVGGKKGQERANGLGNKKSEKDSHENID
jgi:PTH1 family peptidyl-tRNA hydrolase